VADLNERRLRGEVGCQKRRNGMWHPSDVREMMLNPQYRGYRRHTVSDGQFTTSHEYRGIWPAILTKATAKGLDVAFAKRPQGVDTTAKTLLPGVAVCGDCPDRYGNVGRAPMYQYHTPPLRGRAEFDSYRCQLCHRSRRARYLEEYVRDVVNGWLASPEKVGELSANLEFQLSDPEIPVLQRKLTDAEKELDDAYNMGLSARGLKAQEDHWLPEIERLRRELAKRQAAQPKGNGWAAARSVGLERLPEDIREAREWLKRLVWVVCLESPKGRGFHPESVRIESR
jgi:hypothetical protein